MVESSMIENRLLGISYGMGALEILRTSKIKSNFLNKFHNFCENNQVLLEGRPRELISYSDTAILNLNQEYLELKKDLESIIKLETPPTELVERTLRRATGIHRSLVEIYTQIRGSVRMSFW